MLDAAATRRLFYRSLFVALCLGLVFFKLLPLATAPSALPGPDLLFVFTAVWLMRRPNFVPIWLIAPMQFLADLLFLRPPGLWAAISVMAFEFLRKRRLGPTEISLTMEIAMAAGVFAAAQLLYLLVLALFVVPGPTLALSALHVLTTVVAYPFAILVSRFIFGVQRVRPGDLDEDGAAL